MRFVRYDEQRLGLLTESGAGVIDLTDKIGFETDEPLLEYLHAKGDASEYVGEPSDYDRTEVKIDSPVDRPGKVIAAHLVKLE